MKISQVSAAVSLALAALIALPAFAANDGIITFNGLVTDVTCTIEGEAPGGGTVVKNIDLGGVPASLLANAGDRRNLTGFTIRVGSPGETACTDGRTAMIAFDPSSPAIDVATGRLNIDSTADSASNVQVEVTRRDGTPIHVYTEKSEGVVIADNQALIPLAAQYYATGAAGEGEVNTRVGFMVEYAD
ncbi:type 1 fimbrial protein [Pseudomonas gingeri]|uniref:fimbrial protein n=1 Tax=Pseudomonas gingeri TaxID=117681 RepID=UPI0015A2D53A|nr:fimbrial protein [Pseudomonas gingeri]NWA27286.1 type 1 fimbrial protein [Pseudomonas gingeri]NWD75200.1 type 1 fimbrial protein [Pseudomonas gingeri]